jgi:hypothetical protein
MMFGPPKAEDFKRMQKNYGQMHKHFYNIILRHTDEEA